MTTLQEPEALALVRDAITRGERYASQIQLFTNTHRDGLAPLEYSDWIRDLNREPGQQVVWSQPSTHRRPYDENSTEHLMLKSLRSQHVARTVLEALQAAGWVPPSQPSGQDRQGQPAATVSNP
jgi:hypothetical protein